jgi:COP9 signalosome complex subunit 12
VINLLFKTYFKLNSASLSRNILKALSAYQGDMPSLAVFPKSQQVTFKYYEGVLFFLEENYMAVGLDIVPLLPYNIDI